MVDVADILSRHLSTAIRWAEAQEIDVLTSGKPLTVSQVGLARAVGVIDPDQVRIKIVSQIPLPTQPDLRAAAIQTGLLGPGTAGVTFGHGIIILHGHEANRFVSHELRHVHQYEVAGSVAAFLPRYLRQIVTIGYSDAPFELDARQHERDAP